MGSALRRHILGAVASQPKTVSALARELGLKPASIRYHLSLLARHHLVVEVSLPTAGSPGRPPIAYQSASHVAVPGFPIRHFDVLAGAALQTLVEVVGPEEATRRLREKGREVARAMVASWDERAKPPEWTPEAFERVVLGRHFLEFGVATAVISRGPDALAYRLFTCPFLELAERMPDLICDSLDLGFHDGIDALLGDVRTERLACMGHGSPYCEYRMTWAAGKRGKDGRVPNGRSE
jgi:predicted ArsR family transcriptional regulator